MSLTIIGIYENWVFEGGRVNKCNLSPLSLRCLWDTGLEVSRRQLHIQFSQLEGLMGMEIQIQKSGISEATQSTAYRGRKRKWDRSPRMVRSRFREQGRMEKEEMSKSQEDS